MSKVTKLFGRHARISVCLGDDGLGKTINKEDERFVQLEVLNAAAEYSQDAPPSDSYRRLYNRFDEGDVRILDGESNLEPAIDTNVLDPDIPPAGNPDRGRH